MQNIILINSKKILLEYVPDLPISKTVTQLPSPLDTLVVDHIIREVFFKEIRIERWTSSRPWLQTIDWIWIPLLILPSYSLSCAFGSKSERFLYQQFVSPFAQRTHKTCSLTVSKDQAEESSSSRRVFHFTLPQQCPGNKTIWAKQYRSKRYVLVG